MQTRSTYNNNLSRNVGRPIFATSSSNAYENQLRFAPIVNQNLIITDQVTNNTVGAWQRNPAVLLGEDSLNFYFKVY